MLQTRSLFFISSGPLHRKSLAGDLARRAVDCGRDMTLLAFDPKTWTDLENL